MQHYNYIFTGSGLSALMTVYEMILSGKFIDKTILLLDENPKKSNDRTWCFWDDKPSKFEEIISKKWNVALFANENYKQNLDLSQYNYNMIRGLDFYNFIFDLISKQDNIQFAKQKVIYHEEIGNQCIIKTEYQNYRCDKIFNSIYTSDFVENQSKYPLLSQHFIGWFIKSKEAVFNKDIVSFMDFSVEQKGNTRFMYVLPTSSTEALIEYTLFSEKLLLKEEYENEIQDYIKKLGISDYEIVDKEQGNIPMTSYKFWKHNTKNVINIGSVGGWTKASTGFTFKKTSKKARELVRFLEKSFDCAQEDKENLNKSDFRKFHKADKFWFYDLLFLDVLYRRNELGSKVFSSLFKKGNPTLIFKFLDEETTFIEDLQVMLKCPKVVFIRALFKRIF